MHRHPARNVAPDRADFLPPSERELLSYWVPSPEEIDRRTEEIRLTWTPAERRRRAMLASRIQLLPVTPALSRGVSCFD
jgi:hypothetical protein